MEAIGVKTRPALQERINLLKANGYRGFRVSEGEENLEYSIEVGARSNTDIMVIGCGTTIDEAYENLIKRIDKTLDG